MYTATAAQHLLSKSSLAAHLVVVPHSSLKLLAAKSAKLQALAHTSSQFLSFSSPSQSRWKNNLPAIQALAYEDDDDDVYVNSYRRDSPPAERSSAPRMGDRRRYDDSRSSEPPAERSMGDRRRYDDSGSRESLNPRGGFSGGRGGRGGRGSENVGSRASFASRGRGRGRGRGAPFNSERRAPANSERRAPSERPNNGLVLDEATGEMVEYKHPDWKEDPKAARKAKMRPAVAPQVHFETPMSKQPHVAILGGGMSGLVCALTLEQLGIRSTVFDTVTIKPLPFSQDLLTKCLLERCELHTK